MSVFFVAQWTALSNSVDDVEQALARIQEHIINEHSRVLSVRCWRVRWGETPARPGFVWMEEYASLTSVDESDHLETTPACKEVWAPIYASAVPGTYTASVWRDSLRSGWFER